MVSPSSSSRFFLFLLSLRFYAIGPVIYVYGFIICSSNIKFNNTEAVKRVKVVQIKSNEVYDNIMHTTQHIKWYDRTCTKLGIEVLD